ncbi:MAG: hypothetical protein ACREEQ_02185, partial [Caulobacteraceae bacterium]
MEGGAPRRVLMLASRFRMPYRVLRCAAAGGAETHVLGAAGSRGLARSRFCKSHTVSRSPINGQFDRRLAEEIDRLAAARSIDLVFAGDADATRSLISIAQLLDTPCFPMPSLALFDLLNDKWRFGG